MFFAALLIIVRGAGLHRLLTESPLEHIVKRFIIYTLADINACHC